MTTINRDHLGSGDFSGKINWKLSVVFTMLLCLVLVVGGSSLYLLSSILLGLEDLEKEGQQADVARLIHGRLHELISDYVKANLQPKKLAGDYENLFTRFSADMRHYRDTNVNPEIVGQIDKILAQVTDLAEKISRQTGGKSGPRDDLNRIADLHALREAEQKIDSIADRLSEAHESAEEVRLGQDRQMLKIMLVFYVAFVLLAIFLILSANFMVTRLITRPLRSLVQSTSEIARGKLSHKVAVSSNDEIGQLSHTFNLMLDKLRENEKRLKGMAALEERGRIARELHDSLAQELIVLHIELIKAEEGLPAAEGAEARRMIRDMREIVERAYQNVRESIFGLRATVPEKLDLIHTLPQYLAKFTVLKGVPVDLVITQPENIQLSPHSEVQLARIIHEALSNVAKHAHATRSVVKFERDGEFARITIQDDGRGFKLDQAMQKNLHFGLKIMRERAEAVSGKFCVESTAGRGTKVIVHLPLEERTYDTYPLAVGG